MANSKFRCPGCKEYFDQSQKVRLGVKYFHSLECGLKWSAAEGKKKAEKARVYRINERRKENREAKERLKTRSDHAAEAQKAFNEYIRTRDADQPCISCGRHHEGQYHAGHYRTVGACPELRFEPLNCHKQCAPCNNHLSGNIVEYRLSLINRIGQEALDWLESAHEPNKHSVEELQQIKKQYRALTRKLKRGEPATELAKPKQLSEPKACTLQ